MIRIKKIILRGVYYLARIYWFVFRPERRSTKVVLISGGRIFLVRHSYASGNWTFPGGGLEKGESPEQAAVREIKEELNLGIKNLIE